MRILCIYNASSTLLGEMRYMYRKLVRGQSCGMCDISHGLVRMKSEWKRQASDWGYPLELVHTNEISPQLLAEVRDQLPCVVLVEGEKHRPLIGAAELDSCKGDIQAFKSLLDERLETAQKSPRQKRGGKGK